MRRIRTIKPEFFESETVARLGIFARLLFVALWTLADDAGRLRGAPRLIASQVFPYDDVIHEVETGLIEIEVQKLIRRYRVNGSSYILITGWLEHQKIDKPSKSKLPGPDNSDAATHTPIDSSQKDREVSPDILETSTKVRDTSTKLRERSATDLDQDQDQDQNRDQKRSVAPSASPAPRTKTGRRLPDDWSPSQADRHFASDLGLNTDAVASKFRDYWRSVSGAKATKTDWSATWRNWCRNESERRPAARASPAKPAFRNGFAQMLHLDISEAASPQPRNPVSDFLEHHDEQP
jgi:hypothetical protein